MVSPSPIVTLNSNNYIKQTLYVIEIFYSLFHQIRLRLGETECFTQRGHSEECWSHPINPFCLTDDPVGSGRQDFPDSFCSELSVLVSHELHILGVQEADPDVEEGGGGSRHVTHLSPPHLREGNHRVCSLLQLQLELNPVGDRSQLGLPPPLSPTVGEVQTEGEQREMFSEVVKVHEELPRSGLQLAALPPVPAQPFLAPGPGPLSIFSPPGVPQFDQPRSVGVRVLV